MKDINFVKERHEFREGEKRRLRENVCKRRRSGSEGKMGKSSMAKMRIGQVRQDNRDIYKQYIL